MFTTSNKASSIAVGAGVPYVSAALSLTAKEGPRGPELGEANPCGVSPLRAPELGDDDGEAGVASVCAGVVAAAAAAAAGCEGDDAAACELEPVNEAQKLEKPDLSVVGEDC